MSDAAPTFFGFKWYRPSQAELEGLDFPEDVWFAETGGDAIMAWEPENETLVEYGARPDGCPYQRNWSFDQIC